MVTEPNPGNTVAVVEPLDLVAKYENAFTSSLPSHINHEQWVSVVMGAVRSSADVMAAAKNDPGRFLAALLQAARMGLEPGTEQFYLVPFAPKKGAPRVIQGIPGYQGLVELIYRAGAVSSVIVECVYSNDGFTYVPGRDSKPQHTIDWFGEDRGKLVGVYAYATMKDGATSKVIVLGERDIRRAKASSASAHSEYSPWAKHPEGMWMKTAARQLAKWVPTSAEYRRQQLRDAQTVMDERARRNAVVEFPVDMTDGNYVDPLTGEVMTADIVDGEAVDVPTDGQENTP